MQIVKEKIYMVNKATADEFFNDASEFTGRLIERDYNAAWNILFWGLYPEYHYLVSTGKSAKYLSRTN